ncbi:hypothetical protein ACQKWADRAFT_298210 [Trichoderma austrokoningii]
MAGSHPLRHVPYLMHIIHATLTECTPPSNGRAVSYSRCRETKVWLPRYGMLGNERPGYRASHSTFRGATSRRVSTCLITLAFGGRVVCGQLEEGRIRVESALLFLLHGLAWSSSGARP